MRSFIHVCAANMMKASDECKYGHADRRGEGVTQLGEREGSGKVKAH